MNISVKKFSKKSLSLLIALIMVFSALPLTPPISADAAVTTKTVSINGFGTVCKEQSRSADGKITIVNDQEDKNFSVGYISFTGIRNLKDSSYKINNAVYTYQLYIANWTERKGITYYYPTKNNDKFVAEKNKNIMDIGDFYGTVAAHKEKAIDYFGLVSIGNTTYASERGTLSRTVNVTEMLKYALANNLDTIQLVFLLTSYGGRGDQQNTGISGDSWTDAQITVNQNALSVNMMSNDEYVNTYIASRKTSYNVLDNSINNSRAYMSNIYSVDAWATSSDNSYYLENNKTTSDKLRFNAFNVGVALYTGQGDIRFPVVLEKVAVANSSSDYDVYQNIEYTALNNGGSPFRLGNDNNEWQYCNSTTDLTDATSGTGAGQVVTNFSNSTSASKDSYIADRNNINHAKNDKFSTPTTKTFKNYITYTGTGNTTTYCDKLLRPTFKYRADYAVFWYSYKVGDWGWHLTNVHNKEFTLNSNFSCYVINIKPLLDIVKSNDFTSNFSNIYNNSSKYNQSSLNDYYKVMADIVEFDLSKKRLTNENEINSVAKEIKDLVESYKLPELKKYTVTFNNVLGAELKTLNVTPGTTINENDLPSTTSPTYYQNNQHRVYYWAYPGDTEFTVPYTVNDNVEINEKFRLKNCDLKVKSIDGNTSTVSCSVCNGGTYTLDIKAYKDIVSVAQEAINDEAKYDSDSRANLQKVLNNNTVNDCITIKQVDAKISAIQTAINALVLNKYSITVKYVDENGKELAVGEKGATSKTYPAVNYGSILNVVAPTNYDGKKYIVYKWTRDIQGNNTISGLNSSSLGVVVKDAAQYYVYLKKASLDSAVADSSVIVKLNNRSNKVMDVGCVVKGDYTVTITGNKITLTDSNPNPNSVTLTAPNYSFYTLSGFKINGKTVGPGSTVKIDSETVIEPVYTPKDTITITVGSGVAGDNVSTSWDSRVKLTSTLTPTDSQLIKWTANINGADVVWGYGETLSFQATQSCTVRCELISKNEASPSVSVDYVSYNLYKANTITAVSRIAVPEGYTVVEYGTILKTSNNLNSNTPSLSDVENATYEKTNAGGVFKATQQITGTNQFAMNFFAATDYEEMYVGAVAYLVYKQANSNTEYVIYSNTNGGKVVTSSYNKTAVGNN